MRDNYIIDECLGQGSFGEVRRVIWKANMKTKKTSIKQIRAVKILSKNYMEEKERVSLKNEVSSMYLLNHPSIMKLYHYYEDPKRFLIVTDLCKGGDLFDVISVKRMS